MLQAGPGPVLILHWQLSRSSILVPEGDRKELGDHTRRTTSALSYLSAPLTLTYSLEVCQVLGRKLGKWLGACQWGLVWRVCATPNLKFEIINEQCKRFLLSSIERASASPWLLNQARLLNAIAIGRHS